MGTGRAAFTVFAVHVTLLFFPPIPPLYKGSLWSYVLGYLAVALALYGASEWAPRAAAWWSRRTPLRRWAEGLGALAAVAAFGALLRAGLPDAFARFSREEGAWEPITLLIYSAAALVLLRQGRDREAFGDASLGRHLKLIGAGFAFLTLEEIDYFGIFGGAIGRIDGIYVGSLHDLIHLAKASLIPEVVAVAGGVTALSVVGWLWRRGYLQVRRLVRLATSMQAVWLAGGAAFMALAASEEAGLLGVSFGAPSPEELIEMLGALCLAGFAAEVLRGADLGATGTEASTRDDDDRHERRTPAMAGGD